MKAPSRNKEFAAAAQANAAEYEARMDRVAEAQQHVEEPDEPEGTVEKPRKKQRHVSPAAEKAKRAAVLFFYTQLLEPPEEEWDGKHGTVLEIRKRMGLPPGQKHTRMIRRALSAIAAGEGERGRGGGYEGSGGVPKLTMQETLIAARALRTGCGQDQATFKVNAWRQAKGKQPVTPRRRPCSRTTRTTSARSSCGGTCARSWTRSRVRGATQHVLGSRGRHELGLRGRNGSWGRLAFLSRRFTPVAAHPCTYLIKVHKAFINCML
jgi:hypothetical protein